MELNAKNVKLLTPGEKLLQSIVKKVVKGTLRLTVIKAHIVQVEGLASLGDAYLTI